MAPPVTQLELLDLRHFSARQLRPLLEDEARVWKMRLRWDYTSSTELLLQYLDSRILPGFVALDQGRICGFAFCVYEGSKAVVGDAYAYPEQNGASVTNLMLEHLLDMLQHSPNVDRIESQLLFYNPEVVGEVFSARQFQIYPRQFMELDLQDLTTDPGPEDRPFETLELHPWSMVDYHSTAELIHLAYQNHVDSLINDQYRSLHGSLRFLHNIIRFPGCGVFHAGASWTLKEKGHKTPVGVVLCSDVGDGVAHVTQICVVPKLRGFGQARRLMQQCAATLRESGFQAITLTVTAQNLPAVHLYERLGFTTRHHFDAMVWTRASTDELHG